MSLTLEFTAPDHDRFIDPFDDVRLLDYFEDLLLWHGYIRFLGMPHRKDEPDVAMEELYVEPLVSPRWMRPDGLDLEHTEDVAEAVAAHERLVLLGDPGLGKSTLVSWISWQLSRSRRGRWRRLLGDLIPIPMVLRELPIGRGVTWDDLWQAFLELPVAAALKQLSGLEELLANGQVIFLLDGLDEVSSIGVRRDLRAAVVEGMARHSSCRFLLTSRLVGYDEVPFHKIEEDPRKRMSEDLAIQREESQPFAERLYLAPFSDAQIERFAANWYVSREKAEARAKGGSQDLIDAVCRNSHTLSLARVPNLLTFMALIHRVRARLPDGRAFLYDEIAEAYLETIDEFRGLQEMDFPLHQKMRWLGFVAYRMQQRRDDAAEQEEGAREILVEREELEVWLAEEMERDRLEDAKATAAAFRDYLGRRSGLLLPRGEGRFAFAHLSFQEFFAATYLLRLVMAPSRVVKKIEENFEANLQDYANSAVWREALVLLFELLTRQPDQAPDVLDLLWGEGFSRVLDDEECQQVNQLVLLAAVAIDPQSALSTEERQYALELAWTWEYRRQRTLRGWSEVSGVPQTLLQAESEGWLRVFRVGMNQFRDAQNLSLASCPRVEHDGSLDVLPNMSRLRLLSLKSTGIEDISCLTKLSDLMILELDSTGVVDLTPLSGCANLQGLTANSTKVSDLLPLSGLSKLGVLSLNSTRIVDISPLSCLKGLEALVLSSTEVEDVSSLSDLLNLTTIDLHSTSVRDISSLSGLLRLRELYLVKTDIKNISPLSELLNMRVLYLDNTGVVDLLPLSRLADLRQLSLTSTGVSDVSPLADLLSLETLDLRSTEVTDVSSLSGLTNLSYLDLRSTGVVDVSALEGIEGLKIFK